MKKDVLSYIVMLVLVISFVSCMNIILDDVKDVQEDVWDVQEDLKKVQEDLVEEEQSYCEVMKVDIESNKLMIVKLCEEKVKVGKEVIDMRNVQIEEF